MGLFHTARAGRLSFCLLAESCWFLPRKCILAPELLPMQGKGAWQVSKEDFRGRGSSPKAGLNRGTSVIPCQSGQRAGETSFPVLGLSGKAHGSCWSSRAKETEPEGDRIPPARLNSHPSSRCKLQLLIKTPNHPPSQFCQLWRPTPPGVSRAVWF